MYLILTFEYAPIPISYGLKNKTKNNNLLCVIAIQNKNIKTNISHPLQRKNITLIFLFFLKKKSFKVTLKNFVFDFFQI
jgi:hypothetical protein